MRELYNFNGTPIRLIFKENKMQLFETGIHDLFVLQADSFEDERGCF